MKTRNGWMIVALLAATACGGGSSQSSSTTGGGDPPPPPPPVPADDVGNADAPPPPPPPRWVDLRIHGFNLGAFRAALVAVDDVKAWADGEEVPTSVAPKTVDLADPFTTYNLARFELPAAAQTIKLVLLLGAHGGYERAGAAVEAGAIEAVTPICLIFDAARLAGAGDVTVHVDLSRSLSGGETAMFLPNVVVRSGGLHQLRTLLVDDDRAQCPTAEFTRIQDAVDAARAGEKIEVCAGRYDEHVAVAKPLHLRGAGPAPLERDGDPMEEAIVVGLFFLDANHAVVAGFTIVEGDIGVLTSPTSSGYVVRDNFIAVHLAGVVLASDGQKTSVVKRNRIVANAIGVLAIDDCEEDGFRPPALGEPQGDFEAAMAMVVEGYRGQAGSWLGGAPPSAEPPADPSAGTGAAGGAGALTASASTAMHGDHPRHTKHGRFLVLEHNAIHDNDVGVLLACAHDSVVTANDIRGSLIGLLDVAGSDNEYSKNEVHEGSTGMWLIVCRNVVAKRNDTSSNGDFGLGLFGTQLSFVLDNVSNDNLGEGLRLDISWSNVLQGNEARRNGGDGIWATADSFGNFFEQNTLLQNGHHDAHDDLREENLWWGNTCVTDSAPGTICGS